MMIEGLSYLVAKTWLWFLSPSWLERNNGGNPAHYGTE